jgi:thymidylate synthase (FAD)
MQVTLIDHTQNPEEVIAKCAAICYDSDTSPEANQRRIKHLLKLKHLATLRFSYASFLVDGISRACSHQLVRHPHLSYLQESQRYVDSSNATFVYPPNATKEQLEALYCSYSKSLDAYDTMRESGMRKEDARLVLPNATCTRLYVTGNFQAWMDYLKNRTDKAAQWEIREVATIIGQKLAEIAPTIFEEFNVTYNVH